MVGILMMPAKLATVDLLKIRLIWYKDCDVIISVFDATKDCYHVTEIIL